MLVRFVATCLIVALLAGCASTREVHFESLPAGATVRLSGSSCTTPCSMNRGDQVQFAEILHGEEKKVVRVEAVSGTPARAGYGISKAGAVTLKYAAMPFLAVGVLGVVMISGNTTDAFENRNYEVDRSGFYITLGALAAGAALASLGSSLDQVSAGLSPEQDVFVAFERKKQFDNAKPSLTIDEFIGKRVLPVTGP